MQSIIKKISLLTIAIVIGVSMTGEAKHLGGVTLGSKNKDKDYKKHHKEKHEKKKDKPAPAQVEIQTDPVIDVKVEEEPKAE